MEFRTTVVPAGKTATGLPVPDDVVAALGTGKRPAVRVTLGPHTFRTTIAPMGGTSWIPLNAANREAAGVAAGDELTVAVELDTVPRTVDVPDDLAAALAGEPAAGEFFAGLALTHRKEWVRWITEAKREETRTQRLTRTVEALRAGRRTR